MIERTRAMGIRALERSLALEVSASRDVSVRDNQERASKASIAEGIKRAVHKGK